MSDRKNNSLIAKGLHKKYGSRMVVNNVDISVNRNEVVGLLGPNGAGKTTTFYMITGMIKPTKGDIFLDDKKITLDPMYKRARKGVGYLAQEPSIFSKLTVENNLKLVLEMRKDLSIQEQKEKLDGLLDDFSVSSLRGSKGGNLSGGQQQQLAIARALVTEPKVLLLDEPTEGIQPSIIKEMAQKLKVIRDMHGISIIVAEQVLSFTLDACDRFLVMEGGSIVHSSDRKEVDAEKIKSFLSV